MSTKGYIFQFIWYENLSVYPGLNSYEYKNGICVPHLFQTFIEQIIFFSCFFISYYQLIMFIILFSISLSLYVYTH